MSRFEITLRISGDHLDPREITTLLGVEPHLAYRKGGVWKTPKGTSVVGRTGLWNVGAKEVDSGNFEEAIARFLSGIPAAPDVFLALASRFKVELFCGLFLDEYNSGLEISPAVMTLMVERGISLDLDIYSSCDSGEDCED
ncbi:DUF4279 domain-containing protein [Allorhizobium taibaishanense]|uniref:DUF4279 domain-containing protein n=1 Tax=Allorhizobium taibaishanense TaxID=887144 RepID=UPI001F33A1B3|nr:DUF4279 domain-containing protein [Allorhizobium taibaishanense]